MRPRFVEGQSCVTTGDIDLQGYGIIPKGTRLRVNEVCESAGEIGYVAFNYNKEEEAILVGHDLDSVRCDVLSRVQARLVPKLSWIAVALALVFYFTGPNLAHALWWEFGDTQGRQCEKLNGCINDRTPQQRHIEHHHSVSRDRP